MSFLLPTELNFSAEGWGPLSEPPEVFKDIPYAPFSKGDKVGKAADWTMTSTRPQPNRSNLVSTAFNDFEEEEDESVFLLVDNRLYARPATFSQRKFVKGPQKFVRPAPRVKGGVNWQNQAAKRTKAQQRTVNPTKTKFQKKKPAPRTTGTVYAKNKRKTDLSIEIHPTWGEPILSLNLTELRDGHPIPPAETLSMHGILEEYNPRYDTVSIQHPQVLERQWAFERTTFTVSTSDDVILKQLKQKETGNVYATDAILAVLMSAPISAYSWDLSFTKKEGTFVFDKRDGGYTDFLDVNENSNEPPVDEEEGPNSVELLSKEATFLNYAFSQQIFTKNESVMKLAEPNPFVVDNNMKAAATGYFYKKFDLGEDYKVVVRTEVNGYRPPKKGKGKKVPVFIFARALNEYDPKITGGWRKILETQKAGAFATELKNNSCKLSKWLAQAHLAGAQCIKLGWVTRSNPGDSLTHLILDQSEFTIEEFAAEIACSVDSLWGTLKNLLDELSELADGSYKIVRDPTKKFLSIYKIE